MCLSTKGAWGLESATPQRATTLINTCFAHSAMFDVWERPRGARSSRGKLCQKTRPPYQLRVTRVSLARHPLFSRLATMYQACFNRCTINQCDRAHNTSVQPAQSYNQRLLTIDIPCTSHQPHDSCNFVMPSIEHMHGWWVGWMVQ